MYLRSAWGENVTADELIDVLNDAAFKITPPKKSAFRRICSGIVRRFLWWPPVRALNFLRKEAVYRIKAIFSR
jgi:hypothetical protein